MIRCQAAAAEGAAGAEAAARQVVHTACTGEVLKQSRRRCAGAAEAITTAQSAKSATLWLLLLSGRRRRQETQAADIGGTGGVERAAEQAVISAFVRGRESVALSAVASVGVQSREREQHKVSPHASENSVTPPPLQACP